MSKHANLVLQTIAVLTLGICAMLALAGDNKRVLETGEMQPIIGHTDMASGARIDQIENNADGYKISVSVPSEVANGEQGNLEEVVVLGKPLDEQSDRPQLPQLKRYEVINDLEAGRSGLVFYLKNNEDFVLRFNYTDYNPKDMPDPMQ